MSQNLTEALGRWPWAAWLLVAAVGVILELFRRDRWGVIALVGCLAAALLAVSSPAAIWLQLLAWLAGASTALLLLPPWRAARAVFADGGPT